MRYLHNSRPLAPHADRDSIAYSTHHESRVSDVKDHVEDTYDHKMVKSPYDGMDENTVREIPST
jgi:hypothetical protein